MFTLNNYNDTKQVRITYNTFNGYIVRLVQFYNNGIEKCESLVKMKTGFETQEKAVKYAKKIINQTK